MDLGWLESISMLESILKTKEKIIIDSPLSFGFLLKFIYSEKTTKFSEISINYLSYVLPVKYLVEISQNFVGFSEYMNFTTVDFNQKPF